ncbi:MAG: DUF4625 domain-containing protein [Bacteroidales bacterium]|nr:DUF4625 domain-containing protein [Bacteroidales bacterium]
MVTGACKKEDETDTEKPKIDLNAVGVFPVNCDTIYFGETFNFQVVFTDNEELGSFSIDIHNNFDHHSHSTEVTVCDPDPDKDPVNPYTLIDDYDIPSGINNYITDLPIEIPASNGVGPYDEGDYHFFISLTDKEGWSTQKGLSVKMLYR